MPSNLFFISFYSLAQQLLEAGVVFHFVGHRAVHQHIHSFVRVLCSFFFLHIRDALVKLPVATLKVHVFLIPVRNVVVLSANDRRQVFNLLHLFQILITLLVNCLQVFVVHHLHVTQSLLQVGDVTMGIGQ